MTNLYGPYGGPCMGSVKVRGRPSVAGAGSDSDNFTVKRTWGRLVDEAVSL